MSDQIENARIRNNTHLGIEDHGVFTLNVNFFTLNVDFEFGGEVQGIGHLMGIGEHLQDFITKFLGAAGVDKWEDLPRTYVRIRRVDSKIVAIGHIIDDRWFNWVDYFDAIREAKEDAAMEAPDV